MGFNSGFKGLNTYREIEWERATIIQPSYRLASGQEISYTVETLFYHWEKCVTTQTEVLPKCNCSKKKKNLIIRYNLVMTFTTDFTGFLQ